MPTLYCPACSTERDPAHLRDPETCPDCGGELEERLHPSPAIDPVCLVHGLRKSEHDCLYCCLCYKPLTVEECRQLPDGTREDVCEACAAKEARSARPSSLHQECAHQFTRVGQDEDGWVMRRCVKCGEWE